jgi:hypothetical protein
MQGKGFWYNLLSKTPTNATIALSIKGPSMLLREVSTNYTKLLGIFMLELFASSHENGQLLDFVRPDSFRQEGDRCLGHADAIYFMPIRIRSESAMTRGCQAEV